MLFLDWRAFLCWCLSFVFHASQRPASMSFEADGHGTLHFETDRCILLLPLTLIGRACSSYLRRKDVTYAVLGGAYPLPTFTLWGEVGIPII